MTIREEFRAYLNEARIETVYRILHNGDLWVEDLKFDEVKQFIGKNKAHEKEEIQSYNKADNWSDRTYKKENSSKFK